MLPDKVVHAVYEAANGLIAIPQYNNLSKEQAMAVGKAIGKVIRDYLFRNLDNNSMNSDNLAEWITTQATKERPKIKEINNTEISQFTSLTHRDTHAQTGEGNNFEYILKQMKVIIGRRKTSAPATREEAKLESRKLRIR